MACLYSQRVEFLCVNSICVSHPTRLSPRFLRYMLRGFLLSGGVSICIGGGPKWTITVTIFQLFLCKVFLIVDVLFCASYGG